MKDLENTGKINVNKNELKIAKNIFTSAKAEINEVKAVINQVFNENQYVLDPHTAIGLYGSRQNNDSKHLNCILATASPVKFSETVEGAIDKNLNLLDGYDLLFESKEKYIELKNSVDEVKEQILNTNR